MHAGGYARWSALQSDREGREDLCRRGARQPTNYIAQPTLSLSSCPTFVESGHRTAPLPTCACLVLTGRRYAWYPVVARGVAPWSGRQLIAGWRYHDTWVLGDDTATSSVEGS